VISVCGFGLVLTGALNMSAQAGSTQNPIPPDLNSLARGRVTYDAQCAHCHGPLGRGDGPDAAALQPPPANLQVHMAAGHPDDQLFSWVSNGIAGTAMPAFAGGLTENRGKPSSPSGGLHYS
jgi:high-affinity iron transporter